MFAPTRLSLHLISARVGRVMPIVPSTFPFVAPAMASESLIRLRSALPSPTVPMHSFPRLSVTTMATTLVQTPANCNLVAAMTAHTVLSRLFEQQYICVACTESTTGCVRVNGKTSCINAGVCATNICSKGNTCTKSTEICSQSGSCVANVAGVCSIKCQRSRCTDFAAFAL